jgi:hypothetical protein
VALLDGLRGSRRWCGGSLGAVPVFKDVGDEGWLANRNVAVLFFLDVEAEEGEVVAFSVFNFPESILQLPGQERRIHVRHVSNRLRQMR